MNDFLTIHYSLPTPPTKKRQTIIGFKVEKSLAEAIDRAAKATDTDRSKWIRKAIREGFRRAESN